MTAILLKRVQKVIGQRTILDIDQLSVQAGETAAVIGAAGSGKSALLDLLVGRAQPTAGTVQVCGMYPAQHRTEIGQQVGVLAQRNALYKRLSVRHNLTFFCDLRGLPHTRADEVLEQVGLRDQVGTRVQNLQDGLARRLSLGRALLHRPQMLFLFEPFSRCDVASIHVMLDVISAQIEAGVTVLLFAIQPAHLSGLCDTLYTLDNGRITASRRPQESTSAELPFKIPARLDSKVVLINAADILYVTSENGQTTITTIEATYPVHFTLAELEERLRGSGFFRAHRGYLVNMQRIKEVIAYTRDSYTLRLDTPNSIEIPLSKTSARELRDLLGF